MGNRVELTAELNRINDLLKAVKDNLRAKNAGPEEFARAEALAANKRNRAIMELGDDLQKMNAGKSITVKGGTLSKGLSQEGMPDLSKQVGLGKQNLMDTLRSEAKIPLDAPTVNPKAPNLSSVDEAFANTLKHSSIEAPSVAKTITQEADDAYRAGKNLKLNIKGSGKIGMGLGALAAGAAAFLPNTAIAKFVNKVGGAAAENDPGTYLDNAIKDPTLENKVAEMNALKQAKLDEQNKPASPESIHEVAKLLGGQPDMNPKRAIASTGEVPEEQDQPINISKALYGMKPDDLSFEKEREALKRRMYQGGRNSGKEE